MQFQKLKYSSLFLKLIFVFSIAVIFFTGAVTYQHVSSLKEKSAVLGKCFKIHLELEHLISHMKDAETGQRAYIISKNREYLKPFYKSEKSIAKSLQILDSLTDDNADHQKELILITDLIRQRQNFLIKSTALIDQQEYDYGQFSANLAEGNNTMMLLRSKVNAMIAKETKKFKQQHSQYDSIVNNTPLLIYSTLIITLLLLSIAFIRMNRNLVHLKNINDKLKITAEANNLSEIVGSFGNWQLDLQTGKQSYSDNLYRMLGVQPNSFVPSQTEFHKFIHPDDRTFVEEQTKDLHTKGILPTFVYRIIRRDNQIRYFKVRGELSKNLFKRKTVIATTIDVTDEIISTKYIEDRNKELELTNKELSAFNYVASHDLQEPLRKIETFLSRLEDKDFETLSEDGKLCTQKIKSSTNRMRILIEDLLQFSQTTKTEKAFEKSDLNELFENAKLAMLQKIEETLTTVHCNNMPMLTVIPFQIQQLFTNLINNSIKYRKVNQPVHIKITSKLVPENSDNRLPNNNQKYYQIDVEDNGIGFEQIYAENIFTLFKRLHNKDEYEGSGIGLAICKKIVENHDGFIFAYGIPNQGTVFSIFLPAH